MTSGKEEKINSHNSIWLKLHACSLDFWTNLTLYAYVLQYAVITKTHYMTHKLHLHLAPKAAYLLFCTKAHAHTYIQLFINTYTHNEYMHTRAQTHTYSSHSLLSSCGHAHRGHYITHKKASTCAELTALCFLKNQLEQDDYCNPLAHAHWELIKQWFTDKK